MSEMSGLSLIIGIAIANALESLNPAIQPFLKWPNDIYVDNNKIAVVLEDLGYNPVYRYSIQKVEETANTVTISMTKCTITIFLDGILSNNAMQFGVLVPKTDKPINVLTVQTGKPPAFGQPADGLGEC